jgi:hypothetical protein
LSLLITNRCAGRSRRIGFGDKSLKIKPTVFGQAFFEKDCAATVAPVDHAFMPVLIKLFSKVCEQTFFEKVCTKPNITLDYSRSILIVKSMFILENLL